MGKPSAPPKGDKPHKKGKFPSKQGGKKTSQSFTNADGVKIKELEIRHDGFKRPGNVKKKKLFSGRKPVDPKLVEKYTKGEGVRVKKVRNPIKRYKMKRKEAIVKAGEKDIARTEILLTESSGHLEVEEGTYSSRISQQEIREAVDITTAAKSFDLSLSEFGPYRLQYTRNGRHLLIGGKKGHLAAFDWLTKNLHFEINVMESIHDICWLHTEQMLAVAQKKWTYIYDNQGIELHCLKRMDSVLKLEFLPYHFLLCSANETGFLSWLDITLGEEIIQYPTRKGRIEAMCQNPYNAVLCCGHSKGTVTMWTPNCKEPVASMLCHSHPIRALTIDPSGRYMATAGVDRLLKIWDARNLGECLNSYKIRTGASNLSFSQKKLLAVSYGNMVEVYRDITTDGILEPYMQHSGKGYVSSLQFCPYEDILGMGAYGGISSLIIPGAGEPNFDALEANPYISVSGRREAEVKSLLAKLPASLITLDPKTIAQVDIPTLEEKIEAKKKLLWLCPPKVNVEPRYRMKGKSGSAQKFKRKQRVAQEEQRSYLKSSLQQRQELGLKDVTKKEHKKSDLPPQILDRFRPKGKG